MSNEIFMIEACEVAGLYLVEKFTSEVFVCEDFEDFEGRLSSNSFATAAGGPVFSLIGCRCTKEQALKLSMVYGVQDCPGGQQFHFEAGAE